jgi:hypothetical protein
MLAEGTGDRFICERRNCRCRLSGAGRQPLHRW